MKFLFINIVTTPYFFCVNLARIDSEDNKTFVFRSGTDERSTINKMLRKYKNLIGYNIRKQDAVVLSYALYGNPDSPREIYEFANKLKDLHDNGNLFNDGDYKKYIRFLHFTSIIDLKYTNSLKINNILKIGISLGVKNIVSFNNMSFGENVFNEIDAHMQSKLFVLRKLYKLSINKLTIRRILSEEHKYDLLSYSDSDLSRFVLQSKYIESVKTDYNTIKNAVLDYSHIEIGDILPKFNFHNKNIIELYDKLKTTIVFPDKKIDFVVNTKVMQHSFKQGGMHSKNKPSIYDSKDKLIIYIDFNTFYGNLIVNHKIKPNHVKNNFLDIVKQLLNKRDEYKGVNDDMELTYKTIISAISGNLSYKKSIFRDYRESVRLYLTGQLTTLKVIDELELIDSVECIMSNTDGFIITVDENDLGYLNDKLNQLQFEINIPWKRININKLIIKDINNYIYIDEYESVTGVGIFRSKDLVSDSLNAPIIAKSVINYFLYNKPVIDTMRDEDNILEFCIGKIPSNDKLWFVDLEETKRIDNIIRYYVTNNSENICYGKNKDNLTSLISGVSLSIINNINDNVNYKKELNYNYYLTEANKIISSADNKQLTLF